MPRLNSLLRLCCVALVAFAVVGISLAAVTPEQKKELKEIADSEMWQAGKVVRGLRPERSNSAG